MDKILKMSIKNINKIIRKVQCNKRQYLEKTLYL